GWSLSTPPRHAAGHDRHLSRGAGERLWRREAEGQSSRLRGVAHGSGWREGRGVDVREGRVRAPRPRRPEKPVAPHSGPTGEGPHLCPSPAITEIGSKRRSRERQAGRGGARFRGHRRF
ncbi:unnamed protein product, partial [Ectocarpus sp. 13 AM-2016]